MAVTLAQAARTMFPRRTTHSVLPGFGITVGFTLFYLLLIALSEHLQFWLAYLIAAAALVMLIGVYISGVLRSHARGIVAATAMTVVYGLLYMLVLSEDYALLLGATCGCARRARIRERGAPVSRRAPRSRRRFQAGSIVRRSSRLTEPS